MKVIDTTTYFKEDIIMDIRFNVLSPYVDKFIVCESTYTHSGKKKKINFNINNYPKFKDKIIHLILDQEPISLIRKNDLDIQEKRLNSIYRIKDQRNYIQTALDRYSQDDLIMYSDNDEIPNLEKFDLRNTKKKFIIFNQKIFYYKLNLILPNIDWFGSKACKLKNLKNIDNLRNIKNREYSFLRFDTLFSDHKKRSVEVVNNGGWHFSNLKTFKELEIKYLNDENHAEYELQNSSIEKIKDNIERKVVPYNYEAKKNSLDRFNETKLNKTETDILPSYIKKNIDIFEEWLV